MKNIKSNDHICNTFKKGKALLSFEEAVDGFDPAIYKIQNESGRVNYVLRVRLAKGEDDKPKQIAVIQPDTGCAHTGVLRTYLQEIIPQPK